ncbi:hypothetical protein [Actinomadura sp. SCN-SB]|uniref:hypothetical protein n=1 Tax=Actinomadura sp. SCN-SB TaxID=3373092 RepID=UPI0037519113
MTPPPNVEGAFPELGTPSVTSGNTADACGSASHAPGHRVTLDCPVQCIGVETIGDLVRALTDSAARLGLGSPPTHVCHRVKMACALSCVPLPLRVVHALERYQPDVRTVADLMACLRTGAFQEIPRIGQASVKRTKEVLRAAGFSPQDHPYLNEGNDRA